MGSILAWSSVDVKALPDWSRCEIRHSGCSKISPDG